MYIILFFSGVARRVCIVLVFSLSLMGCTAQQWETTKGVMAATVIVGIAVLASMPPPPLITRCETYTRWDGSTYSVCVTR